MKLKFMALRLLPEERDSEGTILERGIADPNVGVVVEVQGDKEYIDSIVEMIGMGLSVDHRIS